MHACCVCACVCACVCVRVCVCVCVCVFFWEPAERLTKSADSLGKGINSGVLMLSCVLFCPHLTAKQHCSQARVCVSASLSGKRSQNRQHSSSWISSHTTHEHIDGKNVYPYSIFFFFSPPIIILTWHSADIQYSLIKCLSYLYDVHWLHNGAGLYSWVSCAVSCREKAN